MMKTAHLCFLFCLAALFLFACGLTAPAVKDTPLPPVSPLPTIPPQPTDTPPLPAPTLTATPLQALPPEPQEITFQAADGQELKGLFYPAASRQAPMVVLMHWVMGDMSDWYEVAVWLQNRGQKNPFPVPDSTLPWWQPGWFPPMPAELSHNVFIFSFRSCAPYDEGCAEPLFNDWLLDAQAAMLKASELAAAQTTAQALKLAHVLPSQEPLKPLRLVAIGSSIGADGAADACFWLNEQNPGVCRGALSLSPGGYLGIPYEEAVRKLGANQPPVAAWCLSSLEEASLCKQAENAGNPAYRSFIFKNGKHGNGLLSPDLKPLPMELIPNFLVQTAWH